MFFGTDEDRNRDESELDGYVQFLLHDYRDQATGRTLIEHYLEDHDLTPAERAEVESMRDARFGLYEMYKIEKGRGIHMRDVFDQETFFVEDITSSRHSVKGDCALLRVQLLEGRYILSGNGMGVPREFLDEMKRFVNAGSGAAGQSDAEFVRANSHLLRRHVQDLYARRLANLKVEDRYGDAVEFWTGTYEVLDRQALLEKLRSLKQLIENASKDSAVNFGWVDPDDRAVHGTIEVSEPRLSLQTMTRKQFELGRGMLEYEAGPLLKYLGDTSTTVEDMKRNVGKGGGRPLPPPSEQEREAILEVKARHYATWPDEKLPALKGKTPRQAIRTKAGREAVRELLSVMENQEARMGKDGDPVYDFDILRRKLGLEGE
jgi:hypothetical protein